MLLVPTSVLLHHETISSRPPCGAPAVSKPRRSCATTLGKLREYHSGPWKPVTSGRYSARAPANLRFLVRWGNAPALTLRDLDYPICANRKAIGMFWIRGCYQYLAVTTRGRTVTWQELLTGDWNTRSRRYLRWIYRLSSWPGKQSNCRRAASAESVCAQPAPRRAARRAWNAAPS
jgi:hypothetical protein